MNFAFKEKYQRIFVRPKEEVGFAMWFAGFLAAGGAAGATALTVSYPLEFTYTRLAADTGGSHGGHAPAGGATPAAQRQYTGIVDCISKTVKADGIRGIYRGYGPSVAGIIVYRAGAALDSPPPRVSSGGAGFDLAGPGRAVPAEPALIRTSWYMERILAPSAKARKQERGEGCE